MLLGLVIGDVSLDHLVKGLDFTYKATIFPFQLIQILGVEYKYSASLQTSTF